MHINMYNKTSASNLESYHKGAGKQLTTRALVVGLMHLIVAKLVHWNKTYLMPDLATGGFKVSAWLLDTGTGRYYVFNNLCSGQKPNCYSPA